VLALWTDNADRNGFAYVDGVGWKRLATTSDSDLPLVTTRVVSLDADGTTVEVAPGERLELRLPENASTGYRWVLEPPDPRCA
jgi:hypothetical protein